MFSETYYLIRSKTDGKYLTARPDDSESGYLLIFKENFDALGYLNTHGGELAVKLGVEPISGHQISGLLKRWGFIGVGIVEDALIPKIEFLRRE